MIAATQAIQRSPDAKLLVVDKQGRRQHALRSALLQFLRPSDLVVANDAATLPASLAGVHLRTGSSIEVRLAGRESLDPTDIWRVSAIVFGAGDYRTRTEDRPLPPALSPGDRLALGPLVATIQRLQNHPRFVLLRFEGSLDKIWAGLALHGRPIQYSHLSSLLALWDVWTPIAGLPVAFEPPSASFVLSWGLIKEMHDRGVDFATITHAAGISSTGDLELDRLLPFDEPYRVPPATAVAIQRAHASQGRVIAVGTSVVRALEDADADAGAQAAHDGAIRAGDGIAKQRIGPQSRLRIVDAILTGTHETGSSHYDLLRAFADESTLVHVSEELDSHGYRTHEFGDSVLMERAKKRT